MNSEKISRGVKQAVNLLRSACNEAPDIDVLVDFFNNGLEICAKTSAAVLFSVSCSLSLIDLSFLRECFLKLIFFLILTKDVFPQLGAVSLFHLEWLLIDD